MSSALRRRSSPTLRTVWARDRRRRLNLRRRASIDCGHADPCRARQPRASSRRCAPRSTPRCPPTSPTSSASSTPTAAATRRRASTRSARWTADRLRTLGATVTAPPQRARASARRSSRDIAGRRPRRPDAPVHRPHGHGVRPGDRGGAAVRDRGRHRDRPRRHRHEERPARRPVRDRRDRARSLGGLPLARLVFVANPDEEIGSPASTPHIRAPRRRRRRLPRPRVRARERRHRLVAQGQPRPRRSRSTAGRPTPGVEPEKGRSAILEAARIVTDAARAQRPLAGRDRQRRRRSRAGRGRTSSPSAARSRSTSAR